MNKSTLGWLLLFVGVLGVSLVVPELALAYQFEAKTQALTTNLISTVLPLLSTLGIVYAVFLALTGDAGAKAKIFAVIGCSLVGFLAPHLINWLKAAAGS